MEWYFIFYKNSKLIPFYIFSSIVAIITRARLRVSIESFSNRDKALQSSRFFCVCFRRFGLILPQQACFLLNKSLSHKSRASLTSRGSGVEIIFEVNLHLNRLSKNWGAINFAFYLNKQTTCCSQWINFQAEKKIQKWIVLWSETFFYKEHLDLRVEDRYCSSSSASVKYSKWPLPRNIGWAPRRIWR